MALNLIKQVFIEPKTHYHHCDGTGRDTYVHHINGGLLTQDKLHDLKLKPKDTHGPLCYTKSSYHKRLNPPSMENKLTHYYPNGTGRDTYIIVNEGGRGNNWSYKNQTENLFHGMLRSYDKLPAINFSQTSKNSGQVRYVTEKEIEQKRTLFQSQKYLSSKLSSPKLALSPSKRNFTPNITKLRKQSSIPTFN